MTIREFAQTINREYHTVRRWVRDGKVRGAFLTGAGVYLIPADTAEGFIPPSLGRPRKPSKTNKRRNGDR